MSKPWFNPALFKRFPEVVAAHSLRDPAKPAEFSLLPTNTDEATALANQHELTAGLGFKRLAAPRLVHGKTMYELADDYSFAKRPEADAIMTDRPGVLIGVGVADCIVALLYDPTHHAIAAVHSGWRGSAANIAGNAVAQMGQRYGTEPKALVAYLSPSPQRFEYGVSSATAAQFDAPYSSPKSPLDRWFDNKLVVFDQLIAAGLSSENIEADPRSNYGAEFHSFRRDREQSGRHLVVIGLTRAAA